MAKRNQRAKRYLLHFQCKKSVCSQDAIQWARNKHRMAGPRIAVSSIIDDALASFPHQSVPAFDSALAVCFPSLDSAFDKTYHMAHLVPLFALPSSCARIRLSP
ncbi:hypothetical protein CISG_09357 [Coccidioides immitis RMSCC 3703]|uniref:Uncharacterized protein n=1 Tax=Coccidioides immitis RMSCC 3703 TaxID=454286 RepID=A0A0J8R9X6_COCIT|nr:hypothetical protein CISG_09357 [Coccidioides immitis RMSCC 3703]